MVETFKPITGEFYLLALMNIMFSIVLHFNTNHILNVNIGLIILFFF